MFGVIRGRRCCPSKGFGLVLVLVMGFWLVGSLEGAIPLTLEASGQISQSQAPSTEWSQTYGGAGSDEALSVVQTSDGGYAIAGYTTSFGAGYQDFWLVKTNSAGNMEWSQTYGGTDDDRARSVVETVDGGYAIAGRTASFGAGDYDFWLVKTDVSGNVLWNQTYGGVGWDEAWSLVQTSDGGYALAGWTWSFGVGFRDFWLVKTDSAGNIEWNQTYGGTDDDRARSVVETVDGGYAIAGRTASFGAGYQDFWLVKTDSAGNMEWSQTYGGTEWDEAWSVVQTSDGGYAIAGGTWSFGAGDFDFWLVKTDSNGNVEWSQTYGGLDWDEAWSVVQTTDGGYALAGGTYSFGFGGSDFWLVKTDSAGNMEWSQTYGGADSDGAWSLVQTSDRGYAIAGWTKSFGAGDHDFWLRKLVGLPGDYVPPSIGVPSREPSGDVMPDQPVKVSVNITDVESGVKNATLSYTTDNGSSWLDLPMNYNSTTGLYEATIPAQSLGTWVKYQIIAYDNAGNPAVNDNMGQYHVYQVIPEFPSAMILPLFMTLSIIAAIFAKTILKRKPKKQPSNPYFSNLSIPKSKPRSRESF